MIVRLYTRADNADMDSKAIGKRLDEAMRVTKVESQAELGRISGVPQPTINRILKGQGKKGPETETLRALASALRVHLRWLQEGLGSMSLSEPPHSESGHIATELEPDAARRSNDEAERMVADLLQRVTEIIETYRLADPAGRSKIDTVARQIRHSLNAVNKAKPGTS